MNYKSHEMVTRYGKQVSLSDEGAEYLPAQESASIKGSEITFDENGIFQIMDKLHPDRKAIAKGVRLRGDSSGGTLVVHLKDNPSGVYDYYDFGPKEKEGLAFDQIIESGTTPDLLDDNLYILL